MTSFLESTAYFNTHPLERSKASWITIFKGSFFCLFLIRYCFKVPPGRYSTTTQQALAGSEFGGSFEGVFDGILSLEVPIDAPTNCNGRKLQKVNYTSQFCLLKELNLTSGKEFKRGEKSSSDRKNYCKFIQKKRENCRWRHISFIFDMV